jgi:BirA family biotin operon repressor/biotin-[acetyl-CoA-carboxylase] ligase
MFPEWTVLNYHSCDSTQTEAKRLIRDVTVFQPYSVVVSQEQTDGHGTNGRRWESPSGNLYMSVVVPVPCGLTAMKGQFLGRVSIGTAVAVLRTLASFEVLACLKWPNDILIEGKKAAGVLVEIEGGFAIIGIGVDVCSSPKLDRLTACVQDYKSVSVEEVQKKTLEELSIVYRHVVNNEFDEIKRDWCAACKDLGQIVERSDGATNGEVVRGLFVDIGDSGEMILDHNGTLVSVFSAQCIRFSNA